MGKVCTKCSGDFPLTSFSKKSSSKDGHNTICKGCKSKLYFLNKIAFQQQNRAWIAANRERRKQYQQEHHQHYYNAIDKQRRRTKSHKLKRRARVAIYSQNPHYRLTNTIRHKVWRSLKTKKNNQHWETLVGYTKTELVTHLESLFLPGMSWDNYGKWHVDHKRPVASFNITSTSCLEFKECWALQNLQPMWALDNLRKSSRC